MPDNLIEFSASAHQYPLLVMHLLHYPLSHAPDQEIVYRVEAAHLCGKGELVRAKPMTYDKEKYRRACTLIEFLTQIAGAMEVAGELRESLSDRLDELIDPIRRDREWLLFAGSFIVRGGPMPDDFDDKLDAVEVRAFEVVPKLRLMVLEAFERHF